MNNKKQIIIHGVDVSKCESYNPLGNYNCGGCRRCEERPNCYFKQLARKTQECEQIKEECEALKLENKEGYEIVAELKQECEELKKIKLKLELNENHNKNEIKKFKKRIRKDREFFKNKISSLTLARKEFLEALDHFNWQIGLVKNDRYRKALEEIEEYVRDNSDFDKSDILTSKTGAYDILNIINKVKGDNR